MSNESYDLIWWLGCLLASGLMAYLSARMAWNKRRRQRRALQRAALPGELRCLFGSQWEVDKMSDRSLQMAARVALPLMRAEVRRLATDVAAYSAGDSDCQECAEKSEKLVEAIRSLELLAAAMDVILIMTLNPRASDSGARWHEAAEKLDTDEEIG